MPNCDNNDIGLYIGVATKISAVKRASLLRSAWQPPTGYTYPCSEHMKKGKVEKRYLSESHMQQFPWLTYSHDKRGLFCRFCVLMADNGGAHKQTPVNKLVKAPLQTFAKLLGKDGDLLTHESSLYHKEAVAMATDFLSVFDKPGDAIINKANIGREKQVRENRDRLTPIVNSIIFLGQQNIPFRGHRDDGELEVDSQQSVVNEGNFRELLKFRVASGDETLRRHLQTASANATYISKTTQNALINSIGQNITETIESKVKKSSYYSIMFDETTDAAHIEQMSFSVRYVDADTSSVREDFLEFTDLLADLEQKAAADDSQTKSEIRLTGEAIGRSVVGLIKKHNFDVTKCVGIGTDGCSVMTSETRGAGTEIMKTATHAVHCTCANHSLNLSLSKSSQVQGIRNSMGVIQQICRFFRASAKRHDVLSAILKSSENTERTTLTGFCETRWVERHDCVLQFCTCYEDIYEALACISEWQDSETSSKAKTLMCAMKDSEFIVAIHSLADVFALTLPLSQALQSEGIDLTVATERARSVISALEAKRAEADATFNEVFESVKSAAESVGVDITMPRVTKRQTHRANVEATNEEEYYRRIIFIPMLDSVLSDMTARFGKYQKIASGLSLLVPKIAIKCTDFTPVEAAVVFYSSILGLGAYKSDITVKLLKAEIFQWRSFWEKREIQTQPVHPVPTTAVESFVACDAMFYPIISKLLQILCTLPVSVATAERSFSTLRRLKTWTRATMGEDRLSALALMHVHRDIEICAERVIDSFAKSRNTRIDFVL